MVFQLTFNLSKYRSKGIFFFKIRSSDVIDKLILETNFGVK